MLLYNFFTASPLKYLAGIVNLLIDNHLAAPTSTSTSTSTSPVASASALRFKHYPTPPPTSYIATTTPASSQFLLSSTTLVISSYIILYLFALVYMAYVLHYQYKRFNLLESATLVYQNNFDVFENWARGTSLQIKEMRSNFKTQQENFIANFESIAEHSTQINTALDLIEEAAKENEVKVRMAKMRVEELERGKVLEKEKLEQKMTEQLAEICQARQAEMAKILDEHGVATFNVQTKFNSATEKALREIEVARKQDREVLDAIRKKIREIDMARQMDREQNEATRIKDQQDFDVKLSREIELARQTEREKFDEARKKTCRDIAIAIEQDREESEAVRMKDRKELDATINNIRRDLQAERAKEELGVSMKKIQQEAKLTREKDREEASPSINTQQVYLPRRKDQEETETAGKRDQETQVQIFQAHSSAEEMRSVAKRRAEENCHLRKAAERRADQLHADFEAFKLATKKLIDDIRAETLQKIETTFHILEASNQAFVSGKKVKALRMLGLSEKKYEVAMKELNDLQELAQKHEESGGTKRLDEDESRALIRVLQTALGDAEKKRNEHSAVIELLRKKGEALQTEIVVQEKRLTDAIKDSKEKHAKLVTELRKEIEQLTTDYRRRENERSQTVERLRTENARVKHDITQLRSNTILNPQRLRQAIDHAVKEDHEERKEDNEAWMKQRKKDQTEMRRMQSEVSKGLTAAVQHRTKTFLRLSQQLDINRDLRLLVNGLAQDVRECQRTLTEIGQRRQERLPKVNKVKYSGLPTPSPSQSPSLEVKRQKTFTTSSSESLPPLKTGTHVKFTGIDHKQSISMDSLSLKAEDNTFLADSSIKYGLWQKAQKEKLLSMQIPDTSYSEITNSPILSNMSISIPALPSANDLFSISASPYESQLSLYHSSDSSEVSMSKFLAPLPQKSKFPHKVIDEVSADKCSKPTLHPPSCVNKSLGTSSSFLAPLAKRDDLFCSTSASETCFAINVFPPAASPPLGSCSSSPPSSSSITRTHRLAPTISPPDTISGIGNDSWALAHEDFCPLASSGLGCPSTANPQSGDKISISFNIKVEEETFLFDDVRGSLPQPSTDLPSESEAMLASDRSGYNLVALGHIPLEPDIKGIYAIRNNSSVSGCPPPTAKMNILSPSHEVEHFSWVSTDDEPFWSCADDSNES